jgi:hypothetical protein
MSLAASDKRQVVAIRFAPDELATIDKAAKQHSQSRSEYVRQQALRASMLKPRTAGGRPRGECRHGLQDCRICQTGRWSR